MGMNRGKRGWVDVRGGMGQVAGVGLGWESEWMKNEMCVWYGRAECSVGRCDSQVDSFLLSPISTTSASPATPSTMFVHLRGFLRLPLRISQLLRVAALVPKRSAV